MSGVGANDHHVKAEKRKKKKSSKKRNRSAHSPEAALTPTAVDVKNSAVSGGARESSEKKKKKKRRQQHLQEVKVESSEAAASSSPSASPQQLQKKKKNTKKRPMQKEKKAEEMQLDGNAAQQKAVEDLSFAQLGVGSALCEAIAALGWKKPTPVQRESLPWALQGRDIIGLAETGSGKTGSFAIPILQALLEAPQPFFALALAPTRELAFQIGEQFEALGSGIGLRCTVIVGGVDAMQQALALARKPHIVIATPGRVLHHLENTKGFSLSALKYLVFDEADRMLSDDFEDEINAILETVPKERITFLYSATMTSKVAKLQRTSLKNPVKVKVSAHKYQTVADLIQNYIFIPAKWKECYLTYVLNEFAGNSCIVFCDTCSMALRTSMMLRALGFSVVPLHGQMSQSKRLGSLAKFKSGERTVLVATDVASRGLDIPSVDLVVNFEIPTNSKDYVHRVGRTARAGRAGRAITFVTQYDVELFQRIEKLTGKKMKVYPTDEETVLVLLERVQEAQRFAAIEIREAQERKELRGKRGEKDDMKGFLLKKRGGPGYKKRKRKGR